jgi:DNA repair exonuclease SbcCD nuclease subunit
MTRILCIGDSHFGVRAREEQCLAVHNWFADLVHDERPDLVLHSGDVFDAWSRPEDRMYVADLLTWMAEVCPIVIAKGGGVHDRKDDAAIMTKLRTKHTVVVEQAAGVHTYGGVIVAAMAWPEPVWLAAQTGTSGEELDQQAREALRACLTGLGAELREFATGLPRLFVAHMLVDGSRVSNGQELIGAALNVGLADLALVGADAYVLGHIHLPQQWDIDDGRRSPGAPCLYTGSPFAKTWGETEPKSVTLLEWNGERFDVERIPTPASRMIHIEAEWCEDHICLPSNVVVAAGLSNPLLHFHERIDVNGAEVRLRYRTPSDRRDEARRAAEQRRDEILEAGAISVKLEPEIHVETRARAPEVAQARTLPDQLQEYWRATGFEPGERREALLSKLWELEAS